MVLTVDRHITPGLKDCRQKSGVPAFQRKPDRQARAGAGTDSTVPTKTAETVVRWMQQCDPRLPNSQSGLIRFPLSAQCNPLQISRNISRRMRSPWRPVAATVCTSARPSSGVERFYHRRHAHMLGVAKENNSIRTTTGETHAKFKTCLLNDIDKRIDNVRSCDVCRSKPISRLRHRCRAFPEHRLGCSHIELGVGPRLYCHNVRHCEPRDMF